MLKLLIVADDLTGANDTGAMLAGLGYPAVASPTHVVWEGLLKDHEVLSINADSRALPPKEAYGRVHSLVQDFYPGGQTVLSKRIDSTLRGNVGAEIDAVLDALPEGAKAAVVSASPGAGRVCVGGAVLVHGVPLMETGMAHDVRTPVHSTFVQEIIAEQSNRERFHVPIDVVIKGPEAILQAIRSTDAPILVFDASTDQHLKSIARAVKDSALPFACFDPGAFTMELMRERFPLPVKQDKLPLIVVGSRTIESKRQVEHLCGVGSFAHYAIDLTALLEDPVKEGRRALDFFAGQTPGEGLILSTVDAPEMPGQSETICRHLCLCAMEVLRERKDIDRCYLSGGDVARGFMEEAGGKGVELLCELLPLAVCGRLMGGPFEGLLLLTKGGMIGGPDAIYEMLQRAKKFD